jgi:hypothetical protein
VIERPAGEQQVLHLVVDFVLMVPENLQDQAKHVLVIGRNPVQWRRRHGIHEALNVIWHLGERGQHDALIAIDNCFFFKFLSFLMFETCSGARRRRQ